MRRTRIKFCGITRPADAIAAATAGADAIGLIFYEGSPRHITVSQAREILRALPPMVTPVGLFVNHKPAQIREIIGQLTLRTVQLHGNESLDCLGELQGLSVIKSFPFDAKNLANSLPQWKNKIAGVLIETPGTGHHGGSGVENNWDGLKSAMKDGIFDQMPVILAGGLTPENVGNVVCKLRPWAVDVSTGIEASPGIKSVEKMQKFAAAVAAADAMGDS